MTDLTLIKNENSPNQDILDLLATVSSDIRKRKARTTLSIIVQEEEKEKINVYGINLKSKLELVGFLDLAKSIVKNN